MRATGNVGKRSQGDSIPSRSTLLGLVRQLQRNLTLNEDEVIERATYLVNSGRVVLTGTFAGQKLQAH